MLESLLGRTVQGCSIVKSYWNACISRAQVTQNPVEGNDWILVNYSPLDPDRLLDITKMGFTVGKLLLFSREMLIVRLIKLLLLSRLSSRLTQRYLEYYMTYYLGCRSSPRACYLYIELFRWWLVG